MPVPVFVVKCPKCGKRAYMLNGSKVYRCVTCDYTEEISKIPDWTPMMWVLPGGKKRGKQ